MRITWDGRTITGVTMIVATLSLLYLLAVSMLNKSVIDDTLEDHHIQLENAVARLESSDSHDSLTRMLEEASEHEAMLGKLVILAANGEELYRTEPAASWLVPSFEPGHNIAYGNNRYYLYTEAAKGLTYITAVGKAEAARHYPSFLNAALAILCLLLALSLIIILLFSTQLLAPASAILGAVSSRIPLSANRRLAPEEARLAIQRLLTERDRTMETVDQYSPSLTTLDFMNDIKGMNPDLLRFEASSMNSGSSLVVLYELRPQGTEADRAATPFEPTKDGLRGMISAVRQFAERFATRSHTFQLEPMQIISIFYDTDRNSLITDIRKQLAKWEHGPFRDGRLAIAVSDQYAPQVSLGEGYRRALEMIGHASGAGKIEVITEWEQPPSVTVQPQRKRKPVLKEFDKPLNVGEETVEEIAEPTAERMDELAEFVLDIIHKKYHQDLSLSYLSDLLSMSSTYLSTYIKEKTGCTFSDHLHRVRVEKAQEMLITTDKTINHIAEQVGYVNFSSFNRMFKKETGVTPREYRKRKIIQYHKSG
ncbi:AraC-like DNA-binding protein [Paenibacillus phyllosphaerae]|uniref:AraC-like DNA-binding protein n=1 Tax=Paenibacillus phyllosphaerae TaxID=274593 RepID=A0A7W5FRR2_9BACL|nr:helix-turn-helix domain-containing protein [Paenibacillus phyllosphaerae]MBB3114567.1 AraC-like DNA-binding protein [Paenibacillus phyllosphaerae]